MLHQKHQPPLVSQEGTAPPDGATPATASVRAEPQPILDRVERLSEVAFGLIMALSITGSLSIAEGGKVDVRTMVIGAIGCNTAWGIVDALMFLVATLTERYRALALLQAMRAEQNTEHAHRMLAARLPEMIAASIRTPELEHLRLQLSGARQLPRVGVTRRDLLGALGVFLLVFLSTLPVVLPFLLPIEPLHALRLSNSVAIAMLFVLGYRLGKYTAQSPLVTGAAAVAIGAALVGLTIALGG